MPFKHEVEYQFSTIFQKIDKNIKLMYIYPATHKYKNIDITYLKNNYTPLNKININDYNGIIVTGAPIEKYNFEEVDFWDEINTFFQNNTLPTIYICWGSQGALYSKFGIEKFSLNKKLFGVYHHEIKINNPFITTNFFAPHSRNTFNKKECILNANLHIIGESKDAGVYMCSTKDFKNIFISGHSEYQKERLKFEFERDKQDIPENYFINDNPENDILFSWQNHQNEFYTNWINFLRRFL